MAWGVTFHRLYSRRLVCISLKQDVVLCVHSQLINTELSAVLTSLRSEYTFVNNGLVWEDASDLLLYIIIFRTANFMFYNCYEGVICR